MCNIDPDVLIILNVSGSNGSFVFTLMDSVDEQFYIEPHTGVLVLLKPLDRETVALYELKVKVCLLTISLIGSFNNL